MVANRKTNQLCYLRVTVTGPFLLRFCVSSLKCTKMRILVIRCFQNCTSSITFFACFHVKDITDMKASFEAGDDPISDREDDVDINSVAGLLKLYFRQLDEKLFPQYIFEDLNKCARECDLGNWFYCLNVLLYWSTSWLPPVSLLRMPSAFVNRLYGSFGHAGFHCSQWL